MSPVSISLKEAYCF